MTTKHSACILLLLAVLLTSNLKAQIFNIQTFNCSVDRDDKAALEKMAKFEVAFFNQVFDTQKNDSLVVNVSLYGKHKDFNEVQKEQLHTTFIDGFYSPMQNHIFLYKTSDFVRILLHETSHCILRNNFVFAPPTWLNEGIATFMGTLFITPDNRVSSRMALGYVKQIGDSIRDRTFNLPEFFKYKRTDWYVKEKREMLYATSYCIVYFLVNYDDKREMLSPVMQMIKQGYSFQNALKTTFGDFDNFVNKFTFFYKTGGGSYH